MKIKELMNLHQIKEASLQDELHNTQKQLQSAVEMCAGMVNFRSAMYHFFIAFTSYFSSRDGSEAQAKS